MIQYAKAAIESGWRILLKIANISENEIDEVYIAGSFGSEVRKDVAFRLCLIPRVSEDKVNYVGNAVITGIRSLLRDQDLLNEVLKIYEIAKVIELPLVEEFNKLFIECTQFH